MSELRDDDDLLRESSLGDAGRSEARLDETGEDEPVDDSDDPDSDDVTEDITEDEPEDPRDARIRELEEAEAQLRQDIESRRRPDTSYNQSPEPLRSTQSEMASLAAALDEHGDAGMAIMQLINQEHQWHRLQTDDRLDRAMFEMRCEANPALRKYEGRIEELLSSYRQAGMNPTREHLLRNIIGDEVLRNDGKAREEQRARGQRRIASQTVRPGGASRSTAATPGGRREQDQDAADKALLMSITWGEANR